MPWPTYTQSRPVCAISSRFVEKRPRSSVSKIQRFALLWYDFIDFLFSRPCWSNMSVHIKTSFHSAVISVQENSEARSVKHLLTFLFCTLWTKLSKFWWNMPFILMGVQLNWLCVGIGNKNKIFNIVLQNTLRDHVMIHANLKPYKCSM